MRLHDLRHAFASVGASAGLTLHVVGTLLGHSNSSVTARYAHLFERELRNAADLIASRITSYLAGEQVTAEQNVLPLVRPA